jgi:hypothetical protein
MLRVRSIFFKVQNPDFRSYFHRITFSLCLYPIIFAIIFYYLTCYHIFFSLSSFFLMFSNFRFYSFPFCKISLTHPTKNVSYYIKFLGVEIAVLWIRILFARSGLNIRPGAGFRSQMKNYFLFNARYSHRDLISKLIINLEVVHSARFVNSSQILKKCLNKRDRFRI